MGDSHFNNAMLITLGGVVGILLCYASIGHNTPQDRPKTSQPYEMITGPVGSYLYNQESGQTFFILEDKALLVNTPDKPTIPDDDEIERIIKKYTDFPELGTSTNRGTEKPKKDDIDLSAFYEVIANAKSGPDTTEPAQLPPASP